MLSGPWEQHPSKRTAEHLVPASSSKMKTVKSEFVLTEREAAPPAAGPPQLQQKWAVPACCSPHTYIACRIGKSAGPTRWGTKDQFPLTSFHALLTKSSLTTVLSQPHSPQWGTELLFVPANWRHLFGALTSLLPQKKLLYTTCTAVDTAKSTRLYNFAPRSSLPCV